MTPGNIVGVVTFFLFVVPGTCYELMRRRIVLPTEESAFVQISRILLSGALFTALTVALLAIMVTISPTSLLNPSAILRGGASYVEANLGLVAKTLTLYILVSALLATAVGDVRAASRRANIRPGTALFGLTEIDIKPGHVAWLAVHMKSGVEILGYYYGATTELEPDKRELVLQAPLKMGKPEKGNPPLLASHWERILILFREIEYISVAYVDHHIPSPESKRTAYLSWIRVNALRAQVCLPVTILLLIAFSFPWPPSPQ